MFDMYAEEAFSTATRHCGITDLDIEKAGVTRGVGMSVSMSLGLQPGDLHGPSLYFPLSHRYINLPKPSEATWTTKRRLRIDQDTQIHFPNQCLSKQTAALTAVLWC